jgi:AsmA protein
VVHLVRAWDGSWNFVGLGGAEKRGPEAKDEGAPSRVSVNHAAIEDGSVKLLDQLRGGEAAVAISRIDLAADDVGPGLPLEARLSAALADERKNFRADIQASRLPASAAELGPGRYPELSGTLALTGLDLAQLRAFLPAELAAIATGGRVDADAKLATGAGRYQVSGSGKLSQLRLRGEPAQGRFDLRASADPATGAAQATLDPISLQGPGVDLGGKATVEVPGERRKGAPTAVRFAVKGPLLDLGQVMGLMPAKEEAKPEKPLALTAEQRRKVKSLDVQGSLDIERVVKGAFVATGLQAKAGLDGGTLSLSEAQAGFFGGRVDASGTRVDLAPALPTWKLRAQLDDVELGKALEAMAGAAPLLGKLSGALDLDGAGVEWAQLKEVLTGNGSLAIAEGALTTSDLGDKVLGAVAQGLRAAGKEGAAGRVGGATGKTELRDLSAQFTVQDGAMSLTRPLSFAAPFGTAQLGGKIGLGGELALQGTAVIPKEQLQAIAGGGVPMPASLSVPLQMGGTLTQPSVGVDAGQAVAGLAGQAAQEKAQELQQEAQERVKREARRGLKDVFRRVK